MHYFSLMDKKSKNGVAGQGPEKPKTFTEGDFRKMVEYDIKTATHLLNALAQDTDALNHLSDFLYGRYMNKIHQTELQQQLEIK